MSRFASLASLLVPLLLAAQVSAGPPAAENNGHRDDERTQFLRIQRDEQGQMVSMETAIVRYRLPGGVKIDLVSVIHIADKAYYDALNRRFKKYDTVLYELVAPPGTEIPRGPKEPQHPVATMQLGMKDMLGLAFQLEQIDYTPRHFVHADMSPEQVAESMQQRGETFFTLFTRAMAQSMQQPTTAAAAPSGSAMFLALFDKNRPLRLKRLLAQQFEDLDGAMAILEGPDGSTLVTDRNQVVLKTLREQLDAGRKRIAIFYGAGHMADFERRLTADFQAKRGKSDWLEAWNLREPAAPRPAAEEPQQ